MTCPCPDRNGGGTDTERSKNKISVKKSAGMAAASVPKEEADAIGFDDLRHFLFHTVQRVRDLFHSAGKRVSSARTSPKPGDAVISTAYRLASLVNQSRIFLSSFTFPELSANRSAN